MVAVKTLVVCHQTVPTTHAFVAVVAAGPRWPPALLLTITTKKGGGVEEKGNQVYPSETMDGWRV